MNIVWNWPQITWATLIGLAVIRHGIMHGELKTEFYNVYERIFWCSIGAAILYFGGFWTGGCNAMKISKFVWKVGRVSLDYNGTTYTPVHGPQIWPWWRLFSVYVCYTNPHIPRCMKSADSWNIWLYSRWGAKCLTFVIRDKQPS